MRNINDFEPQFLVNVFNVNFTEEQSPGSEMVLLPETIDRDEVDDLDDPPTQVCYFIVYGNENGLFVLDIYKHELSVSPSSNNFYLNKNLIYFLILNLKIFNAIHYLDCQDAGQRTTRRTYITY